MSQLRLFGPARIVLRRDCWPVVMGEIQLAGAGGSGVGIFVAVAYEAHGDRPTAIDAVLLDAGGVLLLPGEQVVSQALAPWVQIDVDEVDRSYYLAAAALDAAIAVGANWPGIGQAAQCRALGVPEAHIPEATQALIDQIGLWTRVLPGSTQGLGDLADTDTPLAVVSNSGGTVEKELFDGGVCQVGRGPHTQVVAVIDSYLVGIYKPDPRIFHLGAKAVDADPGRCVYVGDLVHFDVVGAWGAGMWPLHFDPFDVRPHRSGHDHVASLSDVAQLITNMNH
jgi:FMN phosphatase YigB (HAD superfamily)